MHGKALMPSATRTFRVFVSSTFEDLAIEREAIDRNVFPRLQELCEQHGATFQAVDLRWGIREEAALDQQTVAVCTQEVRRCVDTGLRPHMLVLLGERYGWRPLPPRIAASEFDLLMGQVDSGEARRLLAAWYRRDDNALPPEYCLQPRTGEQSDPRVWSRYRAFNRRRASSLNSRCKPSRREPGEDEVSATHLEILEGLAHSRSDLGGVLVFARRDSPDTDAAVRSLKDHLKQRSRAPSSSSTAVTSTNSARLSSPIFGGRFSWI